METIKWIVGGTVVTVLFIVGLVYMGVKIDTFSCNRLEQTTGIETKYEWLGGGCLIKVNDRFIPQENWRGEYQQ